MESVLLTPEKQSLVSSFLEIAIGQTTETAMQFLQATSWQLEDAIQLFYVSNDGGIATAAASQPAPIVENSGARDDVVANHNAEEDEVRPPLPVKRDVLYDDAAFYRLNPSSVVAFRNFEEESKRDGVWETDQSAASTASGSRDNLAALYRPPFELMHEGPFDKAKVEASIQDKWLLVNLQSTDEFSSHMLNRDTWANEAVAQTIRSNFIFWQVYHDTSEGKKVCTYYNLVSIPAILVIDPITGQKMRAWSGMVHPDRLLEDLLPFMDRGPKEHHATPPQKRPRESSQASTISVPAAEADKVSEEDEDLLRAIAASLEHGISSENATATAASNEESESKKVKEVDDTVKRPIYPPLPEEPKGNKDLICRVGIRLPDGRRLQRNFLRTDPVQLLWSYCFLQLEEAKTRPFNFSQAIRGPSKSIEYENKMTFEESGLSNSMIFLTWE